jgi:hypothetical protein
MCDTDFDPAEVWNETRVRATAQTVVEWLWDCVKAQYPRGEMSP